jgi:hypothetical protein
MPLKLDKGTLTCRSFENVRDLDEVIAIAATIAAVLMHTR